MMLSVSGLTDMVADDLQHLRQLVREAQKLLAAATAEVDDDTPAAPNNAPNKYQRRLQKYLQGLALFYEE